MMVLIWDAVRFWHSSSSTKVFWMLRPRMKLTDLNWILAFHDVAERPAHVLVPFVQHLQVSVTAASQGIIFSSGAGRRKPMLSAISHSIAGDDHLRRSPLDHQLQRRRHGEQGLAAARRAGQDHQVDVCGSSRASSAMP